MIPDLEKLDALLAELKPFNATLVTVSKTKPKEAIEQVFKHGHYDFGENYVQELVSKHENLSKDIRWHFIGHLQSNKIKQICPFVHLIHGVDSMQLLTALNKEALKFNRNLDILLQVHIASETTKFGFSEDEARGCFEKMMIEPLERINVRGLMGMATFTEDEGMIKKEFHSLKLLFDELRRNVDDKTGPHFNILSMGMTSDYKIALSEGSNMVRIGSAIFGERNYAQR